MKTHLFNIGNENSLKSGDKADLNAWWKYNVEQNIITAGFDGEPDDRGDIIFNRRINEFDLILAYISGNGYVGVGLAGKNDTYKLLTQSEVNDPAYPALHAHQRKITWLYYILSIDNAIPACDVGGVYPVPAERLVSPAEAEIIIRAFWQNINTVINC